MRYAAPIAAMNGGWMPMLGALARSLHQQNAGVEKSLASSLAPSRVRSVRGARVRVAGRAAGRAAGRIAGFTLIEVMVALIVLVLGVLGAAAMTLSAIRDSKQSGLRSQASALAYELSDLMRASGSGQVGVFTGSLPTAVATCWSTGCIPIDMAKNDYAEWHAKLTGVNGLPNGDAVICRDATNLGSDVATFNPACDGFSTSPLVVKVSWDEKNNNARDAALPTAIMRAHLVVPILPY